MADEKKSRKRKTYSMYRLDSLDKSKDPNDPKQTWSEGGEFETDRDATLAAVLLREIQGNKSPHYSVVKVIREIASQPKVGRKVV